MKRGVLKFTACCLAMGMTVSGTGSVAFAAKGSALAGLGVAGTAESGAAQAQTEAAAAPVEEAAQAKTVAAPVQEEDLEDTTQESSAQEEVLEEAVPETEPTLDTSMSGELAFAQCEDYVNVRTSASADSEAVGKIYNNCSVTILGQMGDWYEVQSGNVTGYVKADFFATGAEADVIADEVAYNVATVYPEALTVRAEASEDSEQIGMVYSTDELEVVQYEGDWMKVALGNGAYGYVSAYYVGYDTYYPTGETLQEEQDRLDQQWLDYLAQQEAERQAAEQAYLDQLAAEQAASEAAYQQQAAADAQYQAEAATQAASDAQAQANAEYQEYLDAQEIADAATQQADEQQVIDTAAAAQQAYQEFLAAQAAADAQAQAEADAAAQAAQAAQNAADAAAQAEADAAAAQAQAQAEADAAAQAQAEADAAAQAATSSLGQQIVNFAVQFVGNPYVWGGTSLTNGADCSGFAQSVFANFGIGIPRTAASQSGSGTPVDLSQIQAGDLLFYSGGSGINHVTIYMGNGQVVHASNSNTGIIISDIGYRTPVSARRYW